MDAAAVSPVLMNRKRFMSAGVFHQIPRIDDSRLAEIFAREVLADLVRKELLSPEWAERILSWRHTGFNVHSLVRTKTKPEAERVGKYMIRSFLTLERLSFLEQEGKVGYRWGRDTADQETMDYLDGDAKTDLIGIWPSQGGVWVKYSKTGAWAQLSTTARHIAAGLMQGGAGGSMALLAEPLGSVAEGPGNLDYQDMAAVGPGDWQFQCQEEKNLTLQDQDVESALNRIPGPGEYGFQCLEQKNLVPGSGIKKEPK